MIKILSSWSKPGGSTIAHIRLCNLFNDNDVECEFYGGHEWHLKKCKGKKMSEFDPKEDDILISHFLLLGKDVPRKRHILSLHETNLYNLQDLKGIGQSVDIWDAIHYVSNSQRAFHNINKTYQIIPNVVEEIDYTKPDGIKDCAGIIGSIDPHKQVHISIQRALKEGFKVKLFGEITDIPYALKQKKWIYHPRVEIMGHLDNQAKMYEQIDKVFHSSQRESFNFIKAECEQIGMPYDGLESAESGAEYWDKKRIYESWTQLLEL